MTDADGECTETQIWLDIAFDCTYLNSENHVRLIKDYAEVGSMLGSMADNPEKFLPKR